MFSKAKDKFMMLKETMSLMIHLMQYLINMFGVFLYIG